ncbi:hypothetical protein N0V88_008166 [Collariella sp. IMI 366227]|nr:hypothetical protein N0V88_008166 [Collariella sp. IMI 366227]
MAEQQNNGGNDLQTFMGMFQQMIMQTQASQGGQRRLPAIDKLTKQEDFPVWRDDLIRTLRRQDLDKYILTDVAEPRDVAARQRWENDKADVEDYIRAMVPGQKVWAMLRAMGWDGTVNNPKATFTLLSNYFEKGSADSNVMMLQEFATIRRKNFGKLETFQSRVNFLRTRLNATTFKMSDDAFIWMTLKGIAKEYSTLYERLVILTETGALTWGDLMMELQRISVDENTQLAMTNVKANTTNANNDNGGGAGGDNPSNNTSNSNNNNNGRRTKEYESCPRCPHPVYKNSKHCGGECGGKHHFGDNCWWCNPELSFDGWANRELAMRLKNERKAKSTTGPLHQQSGNANTINADNNKKTVMFSTNYTMMAMPHFQEGPQRL